MKEKKNREGRKSGFSFRRWLRLAVPEERGIWVICMGISLVFWLLVKMSKTYTSTRPVNYQMYIPADKALLQLPPENLRADIRSTGWNLLRQYLQQDTIFIDLNLNQSDRMVLDGMQLRQAVQNRLVSRDIEVMNLNYSRLSFDLEEKGQKQVPILSEPNLTFHPEYHLLSPIEVKPDSTWISGPVSQLNGVEQVYTDTISLKNLQTDQQLNLRLISPMSTLRLEQTETELSVLVEQYTEWENFIPLQVIKDTRDSLNLFPKQVHLSCVVGLSRYNQLDPSDFTLEIDLREMVISEGRNTVPIRISEQPDYVKHVIISPKAAEFYLVKGE